MKEAIKALAGRLPVGALERALSWSLLRRDAEAIAACPRLASREALWEASARRAEAGGGPVLFIEFGVHEGESLRWFARRLAHPGSRFLGLDTFTGLPEAWGAMPAGTFTTGGREPRLDDHRVGFLPGLFQETAPSLLAQIADLPAMPLLVHYDADLYSSTIFALATIDRLGRPYTAVFDEFTGHEARALHNYRQGWRAGASYHGRVLWRDRWPQQVLCTIEPATAGPASSPGPPPA